MKLLNGLELAGYIKERQAKQVRNLRQAYSVFPKLAIIRTSDDPVIMAYVQKKQAYGQDILVDVIEYAMSDEASAQSKIFELNSDKSVYGIIVQLPLKNPDRTEELLNAVVPEKDVDGLGKRATLDPATPTAISWLLAGYGIDLAHKRILIIGHGRLVGAPLAKMWQDSGYDVEVVDKPVENLGELTIRADIIVSATGQPGLITSEMLKPGVVVIDAATASEGGKVIGDVAPVVRERQDIVITPEKGGVGPLTVAALFDNVIRAAREIAKDQAPS